MNFSLSIGSTSFDLDFKSGPSTTQRNRFRTLFAVGDELITDAWVMFQTEELAIVPGDLFLSPNRICFHGVHMKAGISKNDEFSNIQDIQTVGPKRLEIILKSGQKRIYLIKDYQPHKFKKLVELAFMQWNKYKEAHQPPPPATYNPSSAYPTSPPPPGMPYPAAYPPGYPPPSGMVYAPPPPGMVYGPPPPGMVYAPPPPGMVYAPPPPGMVYAPPPPGMVYAPPPPGAFPSATQPPPHAVPQGPSPTPQFTSGYPAQPAGHQPQPSPNPELAPPNYFQATTTNK